MAEAFDKFKASLNRGITTISVKTSSSLEKTKLKTHMDSLRTEIQRLFSEAGELSYNKWLNGDPDCSALEKMFEDIRQKQDTIAELTEQLGAIDERDSQILGSKAEKAPAAPSNLVCPKCGAVYENPVKFCRSCGTKMPE